MGETEDWECVGEVWEDMWEKRCLKCSKKTKMKTWKCTQGYRFPKPVIQTRTPSVAIIVLYQQLLNFHLCSLPGRESSVLLNCHTLFGKLNSNPTSMKFPLVRKGHFLYLSLELKQIKILLFLPTPSFQVFCKWRVLVFSCCVWAKTYICTSDVAGKLFPGCTYCDNP